MYVKYFLFRDQKSSIDSTGKGAWLAALRRKIGAVCIAMMIKGKNALSVSILNKVHQVEFVLVLRYFPGSVKNIVEKTHIFSIPFSWGENEFGPFTRLLLKPLLQRSHMQLNLRKLFWVSIKWCVEPQQN